MPQYQITAPDGQKYKVTAPEGATQDQVLAYAKQHFANNVAQQVPQPEQPPQPPMGTDANTIAGMGAGAYNTIRQGFEVPAAGVLGALSPLWGGSPTKTMQSVMSFGNYTPDTVKGQAANQAIQGAAGEMFNAIPSVLNYVHTKAGQANAAANNMSLADQQRADTWQTPLITAVGQLAPMALAGKMAPEAKAATVDPAVAMARGAGYRLAPSKIPGAPIGRILEGISGSAKLRGALSKVNQKVTNEIAAESLGLPPKTPLTPENLAKAKEPYNAVYDRVSKLGDVPTDQTYLDQIANVGRSGTESFPDAANPAVGKLREAYAQEKFDAGSAVQHIRKLRAAANKNIKAPFDPERNDLGFAQKQIADALESQIERHLQGTDNAGLVQDFQNARQQLAKINTVKQALANDTGEVSAQALAKAKRKGAPLSGGLKTIAQVAENNKHVTVDASKVVNDTPFSVIDALVGTAAIGGKSAGAKLGGLLDMVAGRPLLRGYLKSGAYQRTLTPMPNRLSGLYPALMLQSEQAAQNPMLRYLQGGK